MDLSFAPVLGLRCARMLLRGGWLFRSRWLLRAATGQCACGLGVESLASTENACDTVVAAFFEVHPDRYRDAFHPQARSHFPITALDGVFHVKMTGTQQRPAKP